MPKEVYCGIRKIPKGKKLGSMKECAELNKISYWGIKKVDPKLLESVQKGAEKKDTSDKMKIKIVGLRAKAMALQKDIQGTKDTKEKEKLKKELEKVRKELTDASEKLKKMSSQKRQSRKGSKKSSKRRSTRGSKRRSKRQSRSKRGSKRGSKKRSRKSKRKN